MLRTGHAWIPSPWARGPAASHSSPPGFPFVEEGAAWEAALLELHIWPVVGSACSGLPAAESEPCSLLLGGVLSAAVKAVHPALATASFSFKEWPLFNCQVASMGIVGT